MFLCDKVRERMCVCMRSSLVCVCVYVCMCVCVGGGEGVVNSCEWSGLAFA